MFGRRENKEGKGLIEVIEFFDETGATMVQRFPQPDEKTHKIDAEIKWGAQLTVRESQAAVFFRDGKALDVFGPGRHVLKTQNLPLLTKTVTSIAYGGISPFRAEVCFCNLKLFRNLGWGTPTKEFIPFRDAELQMIRLGARGYYSMKIDDPQLFVNKIVGTENVFKFTEIEDYLRNMIVSRFHTYLGEIITTVYDLPKIYDKLGIAVKSRLIDDFDKCGLELVDFFIMAISLPEEVEGKIDERTGMNVIRNMNEYFQYNAAQAIKEAAKRNGTAGEGLGLGAGIGLGMKLVEEMKSSQGKEDNPFIKIEKLKELLDKGAITKEEFEVKKKDLLGRI